MMSLTFYTWTISGGQAIPPWWNKPLDANAEDDEHR
jgi:hypothetical protein